MKSIRPIRSILFCLCFAYCSPHNHIHSRPGELLKPADTAIYQTGTTSWYGKNFHGKRTASGEIYDMNLLTAAHTGLPFNTLIEVENLENQKKVLVRINDRGPFVKGRILDLSFEAARRLDCHETGTAPVNIRIIKGSTKIPGSATGSKGGRTPLAEKEPGPGAWAIQTGAFFSDRNAARLVDYLKSILPTLAFQVKFEQGYYKVISESIPAKPQAQEYLRQLTELHIDAFLVIEFLPIPTG